MTLQDEYSRNMKQIYRNQYAVWPAVRPYELGDYGKLDNGIFRKFGNLRDLGVDIDQKIDTIPDSMTAGASRTVGYELSPSITVSPGLPQIPSAAASIKFKFEKKGDWVIATPGVFYDYIDTILVLQDTLRRLYREGTWHSSPIYSPVNNIY